MNRHQLRLVILNCFLRKPEDMNAGAMAIGETIDGPLGKNLLNLLRHEEQPGRRKHTIDSLMEVVDTWLDHREQ